MIEGLEEFASDGVKDVEAFARAVLPALLLQALTEGDAVLLSLGGIDAREKILDVFIAECNRLKEEIKNEQ